MATCLSRGSLCSGLRVRVTPGRPREGRAVLGGAVLTASAYRDSTRVRGQLYPPNRKQEPLVFPCSRPGPPHIPSTAVQGPQASLHHPPCCQSRPGSRWWAQPQGAATEHQGQIVGTVPSWGAPPHHPRTVCPLLCPQRARPLQISTPWCPVRAPCPMRAWWPWAAWPRTSCPAPSPSPGTTRTAVT